MSIVPRDRLLVVRTQDIRDDISRLAQFMGVPAETLDAGRSHEFKAEAKFGCSPKSTRVTCRTASRRDAQI
jgi:hypothetical protein